MSNQYINALINQSYWVMAPIMISHMFIMSIWTQKRLTHRVYIKQGVFSVLIIDLRGLL